MVQLGGENRFVIGVMNSHARFLCSYRRSVIILLSYLSLALSPGYYVWMKIVFAELQDLPVLRDHPK